ncbi:IS4 family transposase [Pseudorhodoferax sp.]|uniref:IS4 family transposase n=1 Tax=Pseudorhodoferax sp. TaxID=1993553 RepID=UPI0039E606C0
MPNAPARTSSTGWLPVTTTVLNAGACPASPGISAAASGRACAHAALAATAAMPRSAQAIACASRPSLPPIERPLSSNDCDCITSHTIIDVRQERVDVPGRREDEAPCRLARHAFRSLPRRARPVGRCGGLGLPSTYAGHGPDPENARTGAVCILLKKKPPDEVPRLDQAIRLIATLGSCPGRKSDGKPGIKATWIGLQRVADFAVGMRCACLAQPRYCSDLRNSPRLMRRVKDGPRWHTS